MPLTHTRTHTYAVMHVSREAYEEIARQLREAGYEHAFHDEGRDGIVLDMHGIAIACRQQQDEVGSTT